EPLEDSFSFTLGEASRWMRQVLFYVTLGAAALLVLAATLRTRARRRPRGVGHARSAAPRGPVRVGPARERGAAPAHGEQRARAHRLPRPRAALPLLQPHLRRMVRHPARA